MNSARYVSLGTEVSYLNFFVQTNLCPLQLSKLGAIIGSELLLRESEQQALHFGSHLPLLTYACSINLSTCSLAL